MRWLLSFALLLLLMGTRSQFVAQQLHFAPWLRAPDATLAVFFLAGLWIPSIALMGVLLGAAALADQAAFASGVSDWCVTAAYVCLIPAYATMWFGGRYCRSVNFASPVGFAKLTGALIITCWVEFVISSGSFFLFSGYFPTMPASEYWSKTIGYYPHYLGWAAVYVVAGIALASIVRPLRSGALQQSR
ncbi:MAG: hypothetical protein H7Y02_03750 [Candidatus Obscuribacterales bacterium]|nr:hypothetical protein [Steroidobacteraceae bacterium]